jgi:hypothetical protein
MPIEERVIMVRSVELYKTSLTRELEQRVEAYDYRKYWLVTGRRLVPNDLLTIWRNNRATKRKCTAAWRIR